MSDMLDKDRIRLMTKMSIYEKNYRDDFKIADYYRKDYAARLSADVAEYTESIRTDYKIMTELDFIFARS